MSEIGDFRFLKVSFNSRKFTFIFVINLKFPYALRCKRGKDNFVVISTRSDVNISPN